MTHRQTTPLVGVLLGYAGTSQKAVEIAGIFRGCPYCVSLRATGRSLAAVYAIPPEHRWWLHWAADFPQETLGLENAAIFFPMEVEALSPWARGKVDPVLEKAPCRADCSGCSKYDQVCPGCPATKYFHARQISD